VCYKGRVAEPCVERMERRIDNDRDESSTPPVDWEPLLSDAMRKYTWDIEHSNKVRTEERLRKEERLRNEKRSHMESFKERSLTGLRPHAGSFKETINRIKQTAETGLGHTKPSAIAPMGDLSASRIRHTYIQPKESAQHIRITRGQVETALDTHTTYTSNPSDDEDRLCDVVNAVGYLRDACSVMIGITDMLNPANNVPLLKGLRGVATSRDPNGFHTNEKWATVFSDILEGRCCRKYTDMIDRLFVDPLHKTTRTGTPMAPRIQQFLVLCIHIMGYVSDDSNSFRGWFKCLYDAMSGVDKITADMSHTDTGGQYSWWLKLEEVRRIQRCAAACYEVCIPALKQEGIRFYHEELSHKTMTNTDIALLCMQRLPDCKALELLTRSTPEIQSLFKLRNREFISIENVSTFGKSENAYTRLDKLHSMARCDEGRPHSTETGASLEALRVQLKDAVQVELKSVRNILFCGKPIRKGSGSKLEQIQRVDMVFTDIGVVQHLNTFLYHCGVRLEENPWYLVTIICGDNHRLEMSGKSIMKTLSRRLRDARHPIADRQLVDKSV
jgi:hypothetical protein